MPHDFRSLRNQFPILERITYLNSGSYGALANSVKDAFEQYLDERLRAGANWELWASKNEAVRGLVAQLLNAVPDEIAMTASASAGINALASALEFSSRRNKIVISDFEFPTNAHIWHAQEKRGARVIHVPPTSDGYIPLESFERAIDHDTQLVAITHVCYRNGAKLDVARVARIAHSKGAKILIDCYQAVGAVPIDVKAFDVDFAVGGMLKYLLGTAGIGFLYARAELIHERLPTNSGWFAQADINAMDITGNRPSPTARRFEAGTPAVVACYAAEAGLELLLSIGVDAVERRIHSLTSRCMEELLTSGWTYRTPSDPARRGPMIAIRSRNSDALCAHLSSRGIVTSHRDNHLRASFHFYNNDGDTDRLLEALRACEHFLPES